MRVLSKCVHGGAKRERVSMLRINRIFNRLLACVLVLSLCSALLPTDAIAVELASLKDQGATLVPVGDEQEASSQNESVDTLASETEGERLRGGDNPTIPMSLAIEHDAQDAANPQMAASAKEADDSDVTQSTEGQSGGNVEFDSENGSVSDDATGRVSSDDASAVQGNEEKEEGGPSDSGSNALGDVPDAKLSLLSNLPTGIFLQQKTTSSCTLASSAMMLRSRCYLSGNTCWSNISESSIQGAAWSSQWLKWNWSYSISGNKLNVSHASVSGISVNSLKNLINQHPEGIVLYAYNSSRSLQHAVLVFDYSGNTFYCADPAQDYSGKKLALGSSLLGKWFGGQSGVLSNTHAYWYVSSYSIANNSHTHSYPVASYTYWNSVNHQTNFAKCSCGKTRNPDYQAHRYKWVGLTNKCTICGTVYDHFTEKGEYLTNKNAVLYSGKTWDTAPLITIPANTVIKANETGFINGWGRYAFKITYKGKTGYVAACDLIPNGYGGKHSYKNGKCTQCGIEQMPSTPGKYRITKNKTIYKNDAFGPAKSLKPGDVIEVVKTETTTSGYLWGWTNDGYTVEMTNADMVKTGSVVRNGTVTTIPEGVYLIRCSGNTFYNMDVYGASKDNSANIQLWRDNGNDAQKFRFAKNNDGTYTITNVNSGKVFDVTGRSHDLGANIQQYASNGGDHQKWYVEKCSNGTYSFRNKNSQLYLDVANGQAKDNTNIWQYQANQSWAQKFVLEPVDTSSKSSVAGTNVLVSGVPSQKTYTGSKITPKPTVKKLVYASDYLRVPESGNSNGGYTNRNDTFTMQPGKTYQVVIASIVRESGSADAVTVLAYDFGADKVASEWLTFKYSNLSQTKTLNPTSASRLTLYSGPRGQCNGVTSVYKNIRVYEVLKSGTDYTLSYKNNVNAGKVSVMITGKGGFLGTRTANFTIKPVAAKPSVSLAYSSTTYNGKAKKPAVTVKVGSRKLSSSQYSVTYKSNTKPGKATVTVKLKGNYTGSASKTFTIKKASSQTESSSGSATTSSAKKPTSVSKKTPSVQYYVHRQTYGWESKYSKKDGASSGTVGQKKRLEGIYIRLANKPVSGSIQYSTHVQTFGWQGWKSEGEMSGTTGKAKRLEAIKIKLSGNMAKKYDVYYRVHAQKFGWMGWAKNGASAGTAGYAYRLEAVQIKLVPKGGKAPGTTKGAFVQKTK